MSNSSSSSRHQHKKFEFKEYFPYSIKYVCCIREICSKTLISLPFISTLYFFVYVECILRFYFDANIHDQNYVESMMMLYFICFGSLYVFFCVNIYCLFMNCCVNCICVGFIFRGYFSQSWSKNLFNLKKKFHVI